MPIDSPHRDYKAYTARWEKCVTFYNGEKAVKDAGTTYMPKISGQTQAKYKAYQARAMFFNAISRTAAALTNSVYQKPPVITLPPQLEYLLEDATGTGISLVELLVAVTMRELITGRTAVLADRDADGVNPPHLVMYNETGVINWKVTGDEQFIVIKEYVEFANPKDPYDVQESVQYRELRFVNGEYSVRLWTSDGSKKGFNVVDEIVPTKNGKPLDFTPFVMITPSGLGFEIDSPPMEDMVNLLNVHLNLAADFANALHVVGTPTPYVTGMESKDDEGKDVTIQLGADTAIIAPEGAKVGFLEFQGQGVKAISDALTKIEGMLAALGARLVDSQTGGGNRETAEGVRHRRSASQAILGNLLGSIEESFTKIVKQIAVWENADPDKVSIKLNRELVKDAIDANMLIALIKAVESGTMSLESFFNNLLEGGFYDANVNFQTEKANIEKMVAERKANEPVTEQPETEDNQDE